MKKFLSLLLLGLVTLFLVSCDALNTDDNGTQLPPIGDLDEVELSLQEKIEFLQDVEIADFSAEWVHLEQFADMSIDFSSASSYEIDGLIEGTENTLDFDLDFKGSFYVSIGENAAETIAYALLEKLILNLASYDYSYTESEGTLLYEDEKTLEANFNLTHSFLLLFEQRAYLRTNGSLSYVSEDNHSEEPVDVNQTFDDVREKSEDTVFGTEEYQALLDTIESIMPSLEVPTEIDFEVLSEALQEFDDFVKVYQSGDVYTVRLYVNKTMIDQQLDMIFALIFANYEEFAEEDPTEGFEQINMIKDMIAETFKSFELDFRIVIEDQTVQQIHFSLSGEVSGIEIEDEDMSFSGNFKVNAIGFTIDLNADAPVLPTQAELDAHEAVEEPAIGDIFDTFN